MRIAYFDCFAGASGDMILGALVDAGCPLEELSAWLARLPLGGYQLRAEAAQRGALQGTKVTVDQEERRRLSLAQMQELCSHPSLPPKVQEEGKAVFHRLAQAEARVHRTGPEAIHLHELGDIDTAVDVLGSLLGLHLLGVEAIFSSPLPSGGGLISTEHGRLPVPAPATLELLAMAQAPLRPVLSPGEMLTPTGAALLTTLASFQPPTFTLERVGYGAGTRDTPDLPNLLRLWLGSTTPGRSEVLLMETNIDDMNPQLYGYVMERLFEQGALDVWFTPIQMKKNRPAVLLSVLAPVAAEPALAETLLRETSTLGLRVRRVERQEAERKGVEFSSSLGKVMVKLKLLSGVPLSLSPEYEDCRRLAQGHHLPLPEVFRIVSVEASAQLLSRREP